MTYSGNVKNPDRVKGVHRYHHPVRGVWYCYHRKSGRRITTEWRSEAFFREVDALNALFAKPKSERVRKPKRPRGSLTLEEVRAALDYDPENGIFIWKADRGPNAKAGAVAGCKKAPSRYYTVKVNSCECAVHRLAWFYVHGQWPTHQIDHIDGDPSNNRIANLRRATHAQNQANRPKTKNNTSGFKGVSFLPGSGKWKAGIGSRKNKVWLGVFNTPEQAYEAYKKAAVERFGEFARF